MSKCCRHPCIVCSDCGALLCGECGEKQEEKSTRTSAWEVAHGKKGVNE